MTLSSLRSVAFPRAIRHSGTSTAPHRVLAVYGSEMKWGPETETERGTRTKTLLTDSVVLPEYGEMLEQLRSTLVSEGLLKLHDPGGMTFVQPTVLVIT